MVVHGGAVLLSGPATATCHGGVLLPQLGSGGTDIVWSMGQQKSALETRVDELMDQVRQADGDYLRLVPPLEEYVRLAQAYDGDSEEFIFDAGAWCETLADTYLALERVDDAVSLIIDATGRGYIEGAESLCDLAEELMRSGCEPQARTLWERARADFGDDVWVYVQAGTEYADLGDHVTALAWLTPGVELALRTGDPEDALEHLVPVRAASLAATGTPPDDLQREAEAGSSA